ncbi:MAG: class I SAM-dependent methyltransferase [Anaerolineaceae bacterium]|nr:class I SAM-dependent methyltransferase [Anaerolineaceae bacterium]
MSPEDIRKQVRKFYDKVGWQMDDEGAYQNARYEDLRPVSQEYIHRCHMRVARYLKPSGRYLLDAGSGPVQYSEYLTYGQGYTFRVCADLSMVALQEARKRLGARSLYVVADVANLPFKPGVFAGVISLHTLHHLPAEEQARAYTGLFRVLADGSSAVIVNGWTESRWMDWLSWLARSMEYLDGLKRKIVSSRSIAQPTPVEVNRKKKTRQKPTGTFIEKENSAWLKETLAGRIPYEVRCWRSVSVNFLRAVIQPGLGGRLWLRFLFNLEEFFPHWFGVNGQYPLIILKKP